MGFPDGQKLVRIGANLVPERRQARLKDDVGGVPVGHRSGFGKPLDHRLKVPKTALRGRDLTGGLFEHLGAPLTRKSAALARIQSVDYCRDPFVVSGAAQ